MTIKTNINENEIVPVSNEIREQAAVANENSIFANGNALLSLILSNSQEYFLIFDRHLHIQVFNEVTRKKIKQVLNFDIKKGISVLFLVQPEKRTALENFFIQVFKGQSQEKEACFSLPDGTLNYFHLSYSPLRDETGNVRAVMVTAQDITEKKEAEKKLIESELLWRTALEGSNQGVWDWDITNNTIHYSSSYKRLYGFEENELTNDVQEWKTRIHPDDLEKVQQAVEKHFTGTDALSDMIYRIKGKDEVYRWIIARGIIVRRDESGAPLRMIGTHTDVSTYTNVEENYKFLFHSNPLPMWTCDLDTMQLLDVNDTAVRHYGFTREEFLQMRISDLCPTEDRLNYEHNIEVNKINTYFISKNLRHQKKNGELMYVEITGHVIERNNKKICLVISQDITQKLESEQRLKISETKYRTLFENNPLPSWIYDIETLEFVEVNKAAVAHYGYTSKEFLQLTLLDIHPDEEKELIYKTIKDIIDQPSHSKTWTHQKKNGESIYVEVKSSKIEYRNKNARLVVVHDKTSQYIAKKELLISNERFRLASLASSDVLWEWNIETDALYLSDPYRTLFGWKDEIEFSDWHYHIHPDDRKSTVLEFRKALDNKNVYRWEKEYQYMKSDGNYATITNRVFIVRSQTGKAIKVVGAIQDISHRKEAEEKIKSSNERFKLASKATSDAIWDLDLTQNHLEWGESLYYLFGYKSKEITFERWSQLIHPDDAAEVEESLLTSLYHSTDNIWRSQYRFMASNGKYRYVLDRGFILRNEEGKAYRAIGSLQDITDLKEKEKELIKSNDRYKYVSLATSDSVIDWNIKKKNVLLSDNFTKNFGWKLPDDRKLSISEFISHTHPEDRKQVWGSADTAINDPNSTLWSSSFRYRRSDNSYAFVVLKGYIIRNSEGESLRLIGAIQDITEKTISERQLKESTERFNAVLKATNDLIWDWNLETGDFYRDSDGLVKVYGVGDETSIQNIHAWLQRIHPEDYNRVQHIINDILHAVEEDTFELEYRFKRDDGRYNYVYDRGIILRNEKGLPVRMIGAAQDITERKKLEKELLRRELDKQKLISQATIETQEQERSEIGKELHDNVNQVLTTTKLYLDLSLSNIEMKDELISKSSKNIIYVINEIRQLSRSLMNPSLGDLGLYESINDLIENIHLTGKLRVTIQCDPSLEEELTENQKLMIYRIVQESLNNALKHAKAKNAHIKILDIDQSVELTIADDGIGFNFDAIKKGSGLKHIQNRVYLANGTLTVNSVPNEGSNIFIKFPINTTNPT